MALLMHAVSILYNVLRQVIGLPLDGSVMGEPGFGSRYVIPCAKNDGSRFGFARHSVKSEAILEWMEDNLLYQKFCTLSGPGAFQLWARCKAVWSCSIVISLSCISGILFQFSSSFWIQFLVVCCSFVDHIDFQYCSTLSIERSREDGGCSEFGCRRSR
uniref:Uncharacterized protein n=1 Tax=Cacopsylla melanoneura TaxID=428564 RepID=A0A8D8VL18_9HEMI